MSSSPGRCPLPRPGSGRSLLQRRKGRSRERPRGSESLLRAARSWHCCQHRAGGWQQGLPTSRVAAGAWRGSRASQGSECFKFFKSQALTGYPGKKSLKR